MLEYHNIFFFIRTSKITEQGAYVFVDNNEIKPIRIKTYLAMDAFLHDTFCI